MLLCGLLAALVVRFVVRLAFRFVLGWGEGEDKVVTRRDRSLGGREVVVGRRGAASPRIAGSSVAANPVTVPRGNAWKGSGGEKREVLPDWWPISSNSSPQASGGEADHLGKEAQRLVRGNKINLPFWLSFDELVFFLFSENSASFHRLN
jgi:hypothetical protein